MKKTISLLLALVLCLCLCACGGSNNPMIGTWQGGTPVGTFTYVFNADGSYTLSITGLFATNSQGTYTYDEKTCVLTLDNEDGVFSRIVELNECYLCFDQVSYGKVYSDGDACAVLDDILGKWKQAAFGEYLDGGGVLEFKKDGTYILTTSVSSDSGIYIYNPATGILELPQDDITLKLSADSSQLVDTESPTLCFMR